MDSKHLFKKEAGFYIQLWVVEIPDTSRSNENYIRTATEIYNAQLWYYKTGCLSHARINYKGLDSLTAMQSAKSDRALYKLSEPRPPDNDILE